MRKGGLVLAVTGLLVSASGFGADAQVEAGRQCGLLKDSLQRLVCYDRIFQAGDVRAPAPILAPPVTLPALGDESLQRKKQEPVAEPATLEATITALKETRPDVVRMTLDNGQIWQQMDMSNVFQVAVGDAVRIEKGKMGGYRLSRTSRGKSGWVRVSRLQ